MVTVEGRNLTRLYATGASMVVQCTTSMLRLQQHDDVALHPYYFPVNHLCMNSVEFRRRLQDSALQLVNEDPNTESIAR